jgi:hypothetical protein
MKPRILMCRTSIALACLIVTTACASGPGGVSGSTPAGNASTHHGGGFVVSTQASPSPATAYAGSLPDSVDLSRFNPPVGSQAAEEDCTAWATGYYLRGWYAKRDGYYPLSGFAALFTYDQAAHASDATSSGETTFRSNLDIQILEGLDTQGDYFEPHRPDGAVYTVADSALTNAARYKIARGYTDYTKQDSTDFINYIKQQLASQNPLALGLYTSPGFDNAGLPGYSALITDTSKNTGAHALFAYGYDQQGLLVENEWGTDWGNAGYAELSWGYVKTFGLEVVSITPLAPTVPAWQRLPGAATDISVGADGSVWALGVTSVTGGYDIYHWDAASWTWKAIPGGAVRIAVDPNGIPWIINNLGGIFKWDGAAWQQLPGAARDLAINGYDGHVHVWMVSTPLVTTHPLLPRTGCGTTGCAAASVAGSVAGVASSCLPVVCEGSIYTWTGSAWSQVPGSAARIAVGKESDNDPWILSASGAISYKQDYGYVLGAPSPTPTPAGWAGWVPLGFPGAAKELVIGGTDGKWNAVGNSDHVWALGRDGALYRWYWQSGEWVSTPDAGLAVAAAPGGNAWVVNTDGAIYELPAWADLDPNQPVPVAHP